MTVFSIKLLPFLLVLFLDGVHLQFQNLVSSEVKGFKNAVGIFKNPVDKAFMAIGNIECAHVKRLVGMDYDQVAGSVEPALNRLTLSFRSKNLQMTYSLNVAAHALSEDQRYDPQRKLIIYIHGFIDDPTHGPNFTPISDAFLSTGEYNILGLDASSLIRFFYLRSTTCVRFVGERLGEVLAALVRKGLNPKSIHLIGHSLGSHIAGFTGKQFTSLTGFRVGRISGLDPAGPCFSLMDRELRLKASDADFVDVIHTDAGVFGLTEPIGHVDVFPNGGSAQPNCLTQTCSHLRVNRLFAESIINPLAFPATACSSHAAFKMGWCDENDVVLMGQPCEPTARGVYYLRTNGRYPYALGEKGLKYRIPLLN